VGDVTREPQSPEAAEAGCDAADSPVPGSVRTSDAVLIEGALRGDTEAWEALIRRYRRLVYSVPLRMGLSGDQADDVFQDTFAILVEKLAAVRDRERVGLWLAVTARRQALARATRSAARREVALEQDFDCARAEESPLDELERIERQVTIRQALESLPERCQRLLRALFYEDPTPSYDELASRLGMARGSLGPIRVRCFDRLRVAVARLRGGR
jgi:RNA polymerase sigma factor (sigma-70 family)